MSQKSSRPVFLVSQNLEDVVNTLYKKVIVFFHESCQDGEVANVCAIQGLRDLGCTLEIKSIGRSYQRDFSVLDSDGRLLHDLNGALIFYVDFAPLPDELALVDKDNFVVVLDHHDTARKHYGVEQVSRNTAKRCLDQKTGHLILIDNDRSGAGVTWDFFNSGTPRPILVSLVEDRDLWKFNYKGSKEMALFIQNNPPRDWMKFFNRFNNNSKFRSRFMRDSKSYFDEIQGLISELSRRSELFVATGGTSYRIIESTLHHSDLANKILQDNPAISFAVVMVNKGEGKYKLSFRSEDSRMSVGSFCERYGGGGHRNAAGLNLQLFEGETIEGKIFELVNQYLG